MQKLLVYQWLVQRDAEVGRFHINRLLEFVICGVSGVLNAPLVGSLCTGGGAGATGEAAEEGRMRRNGWKRCWSFNVVRIRAPFSSLAAGPLAGQS